MTKLRGKVALVTGAGQGIGRAIAMKLAEEGANLVLNDLDEALAKETCEAAKERGIKAIPYAGSVSQDGFAQGFIDVAMNEWNDIGIIVNNAGYTWDNVIHKITDEQFDAMIDVHLRAPFRILRAAAEPLRMLAKRDADNGVSIVRKIVNISSTSGTMGNPGQANYSSAKAGVIGLTKTLAKEWGRHQVTVNCVAFAYIQTRLTNAVDGTKTQVTVDGNTVGIGMPSASIEALNRTIPMGRGGTVDEAAGAVYLFCIPESDYVSGQTIVCGGGFGGLA